MELVLRRRLIVEGRDCVIEVVQVAFTDRHKTCLGEALIGLLVLDRRGDRSRTRSEKAKADGNHPQAPTECQRIRRNSLSVERFVCQ